MHPQIPPERKVIDIIAWRLWPLFNINFNSFKFTQNRSKRRTMSYEDENTATKGATNGKIFSDKFCLSSEV